MITVVSGLPRSGTSMMMQMLAAGGLPVLCDVDRKADTDNPKGYFEWEPIKQLRANPAPIVEAKDKAVKVFSPFIPSLPADHEYRIIFMHRPLLEILKSQKEMLRRGIQREPKIDPHALEESFRWHLTAVDDWQNSRPNMRIARVDYHSVLREPEVAAREIAIFLGIPLDLNAMAQAVDPSLYRTRLEETIHA